MSFYNKTTNQFLILLLLTIFLPLKGQQVFEGDYAQRQLTWVESKLDSMSLEEKIGQLFMVAVRPQDGEAMKKQVALQVQKEKIGGVIFFKTDPKTQVEWTNHFQLLSETPLLVAIDGEWGLSMRLSNTTKFPRQLTLGAIEDEQLIYDMGKEVARQCKRMGIHINLAPVVDVNNNPNNPVINDRSFGENQVNVARKSIAYMQGMEMNGIIACAKHFPGHGDTDADSHHTLPVIRHSKERLYEVELYPFREMIKQQVGSIMTAHLSIPALDNTPMTNTAKENTPPMPASLSKKIVTDLLRTEMGYDGLVMTDALNMKGVASFFPPGEVDLQAYLAGNDILLYSEDVSKGISKIKEAISNGTITEDNLNERVRKILKAKFRVGLEKFKPISTKNLDADLNSPESERLRRGLIAEAITVVCNEKEILPLLGLEQQRIASVALGSNLLTPFQQLMSKYTSIKHFNLPKKATEGELKYALDKAGLFSTVIVSFHNMSRHASKNHGITQAELDFVKSLQAKTNVIVVLFGTPYSLDKFTESETVVVAYQNDTETQQLTAQVLFGALPAKGKLPVSNNVKYPEGSGETWEGSIRLKYGKPEDAGLKSGFFYKIDTIVQQAIKIGATPGAQVLVAKDGMVIWEKAYGHHTYTRKQAVTTEDLYDLASITKVGATLPVLMEMYDLGILSLDHTLGDFLPQYAKTNKGPLKFRDVLTHQARLRSWIPFYQKTIDPKIYKKTYSAVATPEFALPVAKNMYMKKSYVDEMWKQIIESDLRSSSGYKYSDLGYYFFHKIIEEHYTQEPMELYLDKNYYAPLGMDRTAYNPLTRFDKKEIVPTENDKTFRKQLLQGYVHDMGAAMVGGVCGHAGLFSNANDLAKMMQLYLNGGTYGDRVYLDPLTIETFAQKQNEQCRRGLGFDKPEVGNPDRSPACESAPASVYGHTGFTGTCAWVDPDNGLVFIFLSNRVHPNMNNTKLIKYNVRTDIQEILYNAIKDSQEL